MVLFNPQSPTCGPSAASLWGFRSIFLAGKASAFLLHLLLSPSAPEHIIPTYQSWLLRQCLKRLIY